MILIMILIILDQYYKCILSSNCKIKYMFKALIEGFFKSPSFGKNYKDF